MRIWGGVVLSEFVLESWRGNLGWNRGVGFLLEVVVWQFWCGTFGRNHGVGVLRWNRGVGIYGLNRGVGVVLGTQVWQSLDGIVVWEV